MRWFPLMGGTLLLGCTVTTTSSPPPATPTATTATLEMNIDRPGADYRSFEIGSGRPEECRDACLGDPSCEAFTLARPGVQGQYARCWLKNQMVPAVSNACCVSGIKSYAGPSPGWQSPPPSPWAGAPPPAAAPAPAPAPAPPPPPAPAPPASPAAPGTPWVGRPPPPAGVWEPNVDRPGADYANFILQEPRPELCREACVRDARCRAFTYYNQGVQGGYAHCWLKTAVPPARNSTCCISGIK